jgi:hypothetical protein
MFALLLATVLSVEDVAPKPHVLFILVDDLGWADVGFNREVTDKEVNYRQIPRPPHDHVQRTFCRIASGYAAVALLTATCDRPHGLIALSPGREPEPRRSGRVWHPPHQALRAPVSSKIHQRFGMCR